MLSSYSILFYTTSNQISFFFQKETIKVMAAVTLPFYLRQILLCEIGTLYALFKQITNLLFLVGFQIL